jgi:monofunctional biosynthetic peptidoglycan transglycosylase
MSSKGWAKSSLRRIKRIFLIVFVSQLVYIIALRWIDPPVTITQLMSVVQGYGLKRDYVHMKDISPYAGLAIISAEDQLFPDHNGIDIKSIERAIQHNQKSERIRGGSTISQQVAKNVFLWQGRSWTRKGLEAYFTFMIELIWDKQRILEVYLNVAEMGRGVYGIEAASQYYFKKSAKKLTRLESARIAACLPHPKKYGVNPPSPYVIVRSEWILRQMNNLETDQDIERLLSNSTTKKF